MAAKREPRRTAGNRMSKVLEEELDEDDFYKNTYGGFNDKEDDNDFDAEREDSADEVDSDFDASEREDEIVSDQDEETIKKEEKRKKQAAQSSKGYKEPKKKKDEETGPPAPKKEKREKKQTEDQPSTSTAVPDAPSRKSSRRATAANSYLIGMKVKERKLADQKKKVTKKPMVGVRRLTQEELMQEAERTERKNLKSLHHYQRLEASRKKVSNKKRTIDEPKIKYFSTVMPDVDGNGKISRNFITFSDVSVMKKEFHWKKVPKIAKLVCPVTNKPAKYIDPLTSIPYYDLESFKLIRQAYGLAQKEKSK